MTFQEASVVACVAISNCGFIKDTCRLEAKNVIKTALVELGTSHNRDYATALKVLDSYLDETTPPIGIAKFQAWCAKRLNG